MIVDGPRILNIARWGGQAVALAAVSNDYGRTWTLSTPEQPADGRQQALRRHAQHRAALPGLHHHGRLRQPPLAR